MNSGQLILESASWSNLHIIAEISLLNTLCLFFSKSAQIAHFDKDYFLPAILLNTTPKEYSFKCFSDSLASWRSLQKYSSFSMTLIRAYSTSWVRPRKGQGGHIEEECQSSWSEAGKTNCMNSRQFRYPSWSASYSSIIIYASSSVISI